MSKGLEALKRIRQETCPATYMSDFDKNECCDIIETALKEYEMEHTLRIRLENINYELVKEKQENEKKLKALEIIKSAGFSLEFDESQNEWFLHITARGTGAKTYNLLKEVLL